MSWHLDRLGVDTAANQNPRSERIGVPHLARPDFIAAPHDPRDVWNQSEHAPSDVCVFGNALWALDRFLDVRDNAVPPASHLIAEESKSANCTAAHRALGNDAACFAILPDRSLLDHEAAFGHGRSALSGRGRTGRGGRVAQRLLRRPFRSDEPSVLRRRAATSRGRSHTRALHASRAFSTRHLAWRSFS
jgi:hypothetical protein